MPRLRSRLLCSVLFALIAFSGAAQADWLDDVRQGGHLIVILHGGPYSTQADTEPLNIKNVAAQRQLNDQGRALAKMTGESMRTLKIPVGAVVTSMFQRAVDTGSLLGFGEVTSTVDVTEGGLVVTPDENNRRAQAFRKLASTPPPAGSNVVVVSHKPNIMDAFGKDWFDVREGEASVFKPDGQGGYKPVVRIKSDEWAAMVKAAQ